MAPRRALVRIDGDTRQLPDGDSLVGAGLVNFSESRSTSAPNDVVPVNSLAAVSATADISVAILPRGLGAFTLGVADNTATGGNKRGANSADLQTVRTVATQVASGLGAFTAGRNCTASGTASIAIGNGCTASQVGSLAFGSTTTSSGVGALAIGQGATASGGYSIAAGVSSMATATYTFALGQSCVADGIASTATGRTAIARGMYGAQARQAHFGTAGAQQDRLFRLVRTTTNATEAPLTADNAATATAVNTINLVANSTYLIKCSVTARDSTGVSGSWDVAALAKMGANASTIALVGTPTIAALFKDSGAVAWAPTVTVNTTLGTVNINGAGSTTSTMWSASGISIETVY